MNIAEISIKRPTLLIVVFAVLTFLGIVSYKQLNYELLPKYSEPVLMVITMYPGASPVEVENSVTKKVEDAVSSLEQIDNIQSYSYEGYSVSVIIFNQNANMDKALQNAQQKVANIEASLPKDVLKPMIYNFQMSDLPIMQLGVTAKMSSTELYDIVKQKIQPMLSRIGGVSQINLIGGEEREIKINIDATKLETYKLSLLQITQALKASNLDFPTGRVKNADKQTIVRLSGKFSTLEDIRNLVVATDMQGNPILLTDVAEVQDSKKEISSINRVNGLASIGMLIQKQPDGNEVKISEEVRKELKRIEEIYKDKGVKFSVANDTSDFTLASANAVMSDLAWAVLLVALVMLVFLHSLRNSFIVMVAIPASLISVFTGMYLLNFSLNIISLVAMSLVIGILVDDSIVVLENIYRHLEMGKDRRRAALDGRNEINYTALSITLVDVVVFLPIAVISSVISGMLRQFALVVVISTLLSLFVSFTITPWLASRLAKVEHYRKGSFLARIIEWFEEIVDRRLADKYASMLTWALRHKAIVLIGSFVLFIASFMLLAGGFIGSEFVSMGDRGELIIQLELPKSATIEQTNRQALMAESIIRQKPEVTSVFSTVGQSSGFFGQTGGAYQAELHVKMVSKEKRNITADKFALVLKKELTSRLTGVKVKSNIVSILGTSDMAPIQLIVTGNNLDSIMLYANRIMHEAKQVPGASEIDLSVESGNPEISITLDKNKMARLGLSMEIVGATLQTAFSGNNDVKFRQNDNEYDINVMLDAFDRRSMNDVANVSFINNQGQIIRLNQFATLSQTTGTTVLQRYSRISAVSVNVQVSGRPVGSVGEDILKRVDKMHKPAEISVIPEGDLKYQSQAFGSMGLALLASILFVYLIMVALYDSFLYPFVVLFSIPLAMVGALFALALTKQALTIFSILGIIMLVGLVGKNAILLVDFTNQLKAKGHNTIRALITAGRVRLRPILMTTLSMIAGMLPIALASGAGSEWKNGMAWALIGGLTSSLILTLVVVPSIYLIFDKIAARMSRRKN
jgi:hydrophobic/amphiphilic exporter-1 (mainly G- bacteria), HAE1 family